MAKKKEDLYEGSEHWPEFRNVAYVRAFDDGEGDILVQGARGDQWEVDRTEFYANYKPVTPNKS